MTRFVAHPTPVGGQLNYAFDEGKDAGGCGMPAKVTSGSAAACLFYPNNAIDCGSTSALVRYLHAQPVNEEPERVAAALDALLQGIGAGVFERAGSEG